MFMDIRIQYYVQNSNHVQIAVKRDFWLCNHNQNKYEGI